MTSNQAPITYVDWLSFEKANLRLSDCIKAARISHDFVLAINRGGAISGVLLSHYLKIRDMLTFSIQLTKNNEANAGRTEPKIIGASIFHHLEGKHVLLVDDAVGTGDTLDIARNLLQNAGCASLHTAATIWNMEAHPTCPADYWGDTTPGWVLFPWEVERGA